LQSDDGSSTLNVYPKELKTGSWTDIGTFMFIAALSAIDERWNGTKYSLPYTWINKIW
jgi:hypothetical protein